VLFSEIVGFEHPELMEHLPKPIAKDPKQLVLWLAACDEKQSEHPLGKAVVNAAISICGADVTRSEDGVEVSDFEVRVAPGNMAGIQLCFCRHQQLAVESIHETYNLGRWKL
jgi:cation transport ATPase